MRDEMPELRGEMPEFGVDHIQRLWRFGNLDKIFSWKYASKIIGI